MNILALTTDAYGGRGGIAQYNRDLLCAMSRYPDAKSIRAFARSAVDPIGDLSPNLHFWASEKEGKFSYVTKVLGEALRPGNVDLVFCGHINMLPLARLLKSRFGCPLALMTHGIDVWRPPTSACVRRALCIVDTVMSVSQVTLGRMCAWADLDGKRSFILPNAIELDRYHPAPKASDLVQRFDLAKRQVLMTLGRLDSRERAKGFDEVLEVLPGLMVERPDLCYLIVGEGDDAPRLRRKADELGLGDSVILTGFVPEERKVDYYNLADAYVMPSRGEGFGFVFLEAMACGVPVVASACDGSREAVREGKLGAMVDPDDPDALRSAIVEALRKPKGVVPEGLDYFSYGQFTDRCHAMMRELGDLGTAR